MKRAKDKFVYRAIADFNSRISTDLVVKKGDLLDVYTSSMGQNWWKVKNKKTKKKGLIPKNFVVKNEIDYENFEGFLNLSRQEAYLKLMIPGINSGTFLIRPCRDNANLALSVKYEKSNGIYDVAHYIIFQKHSNEFFINENCIFKNIFDLVHYYSVNLILRTTLNEIYNTYYSLPPLDKCEIPREDIELKRKIDKGQFGEVHLGIWCKQIEVAVKILYNSDLNSKQFFREAQIIQQLQHPNILQLIGICTQPSDQPFYLITEYITYGNIKNFLKRKSSKEILTEHLIQMIYQVAEGMAYLAFQNVIHRDLRADNILIANDFTMKIADFGLARLVSDAIYLSSHTDINYPKKWAAPELIRTGNQFSEKSDVWSYGVTCYEILSRGGTPYEGEKADDVTRKVLNGFILTFPNDFQCPKDIKNIIICCWRQNPDERPTFQELCEKFKKRYVND